MGNGEREEGKEDGAKCGLHKGSFFGDARPRPCDLGGI